MFKVGQELLNYRFTALRHDIPQLFKTYLEVIGLNKLECGEPIASSHQAITFMNISQKHPLVNIPRRLAQLTLWLGYGFERMPLPSNDLQVTFEKLIKALYDHFNDYIYYRDFRLAFAQRAEDNYMSVEMLKVMDQLQQQLIIVYMAEVFTGSIGEFLWVLALYRRNSFSSRLHHF